MSYQIELITNLTINVKNCNLKHLTVKFLFALTDLFQQFVSAVLLYYFEEYYKSGELKKILNIDNYRKKSVNVRTKFKTLFGDIYVPQIQIRTKEVTAKSLSKRVKIQKDKWHVFYQLKYYLWSDGVKKE